MSIELKPCPFCGADGDQIQFGNPNMIGTWVYCTQCEAHSRTIIAPKESGIGAAAKAWNTRHEAAKNSDQSKLRAGGHEVNLVESGEKLTGQPDELTKRHKELRDRFNRAAAEYSAKMHKWEKVSDDAHEWQGIADDAMCLIDDLMEQAPKRESIAPMMKEVDIGEIDLMPGNVVFIPHNEWQPIETAPKVDNECVLAYCAARDGETPHLNNICMVFWDEESGAWLTAYQMKAIENSRWHLTHWMPLPSEPTNEIEDGAGDAT